jgi:hypothetical protein
MKDLQLSLPELFFVGATRGIAGVGIGLLAAEVVRPDARRSVGWTLLAIGALTTIPIAAKVFGRPQPPLLAD